MPPQHLAEDTSKDSVSDHRLLIVSILLACCSLCSFLTLVAYYLEVHPRYINLFVFPPNSQFRNSSWGFITHSSFVFGTFPLERDFLLRKQAFVPIEQNSSNWYGIIYYFDTELSNYDWVRNEVASDCDLWLPEADFLSPGKNGYVHYFRSGFEKHLYFGKYYLGDTVCLAVWPSKGGGGYNIVLLTAKPSYMRYFWDIFSG